MNNLQRIKVILLSAAVTLIISCGRDSKIVDAYGTFEATEVLVSAEAGGKIIDLTIDEGDELAAGQHVATIDTTMLILQRAELMAGIKGARSQMAAADAQAQAVQQQIDNFELDLARVRNMLKDNAATQKQLDDLTGALRVAQSQLKAAREQKQAAAAQLEAFLAKKDLLEEQIRRCRVINPLAGQVLQTYVEENELTAVGRPLYKIADTKNMILRVYASGGQLRNIKIGQECTVRIDHGDGYKEFSGKVSWISDQAEFTPKIIQTKEERVNLVYAVKIQVENDGAIKIGMPGEVIF